MHYYTMAVNGRVKIFTFTLPTVRCCVYNLGMRTAGLHGWQVDAAKALEIQAELAARVERTGGAIAPKLIAGVDISVDRENGTGTAAVVVLDYPGLEVVEVRTVTDRLGFPYVPGLLSFREAPLILAACEELAVAPDLIMVDGQGIAHPRRLGLAVVLEIRMEGYWCDKCHRIDRETTKSWHRKGRYPRI